MTAAAVPSYNGDKHVCGRCGDCHHRWIVAYLPMPLREFAALARAARCPKCASAKVFVATDENG